jgi:hypothetical protein
VFVTDDLADTHEEPAKPPRRRAGTPFVAAGLTKQLQRNLMAIAESATAQIPAVQLVAKQISEQHAKMFADLARVTTPRFDLPKIVVPPLKLDYQALFPNLEEINAQILRQLEPTFAAFREVQRAQFARMFADLAKLAETIWPPNWKGAGQPPAELLDRLLLDEGLCLAWVPPAPVLRGLFAADTPQTRRKIIGANWKRIALAAREELEQVTAPRLKDHIPFALKAVGAVLAGNHEAGQALAANLLDSILRREFSRSDRHSITSQTDRLDIDDYPPRLALVLGGIWGAHGEYWPDRGDQIPRRFSRHASAHGVSKRQYSRINATISVMHVTALLRVIQLDVFR